MYQYFNVYYIKLHISVNHTVVLFPNPETTQLHQSLTKVHFAVKGKKENSVRTIHCPPTLAQLKKQ